MKKMVGKIRAKNQSTLINWNFSWIMSNISDLSKMSFALWAANIAEIAFINYFFYFSIKNLWNNSSYFFSIWLIDVIPAKSPDFTQSKILALGSNYV